MNEKILIKKLATVTKSIKNIPKRGFNKFHNYSYATESDVAEVVREELAKLNIVLVPNMKNHTIREHITQKGNREYIVTVDMEFTFIDGDSGETIAFNMSGEGQDSGDKGIYKAITGAQKYALMKFFVIPTGDDPERDESVDERNNAPEKTISQKQVGLLKTLVKKFATARGRTDDEVYQALKIKDITKLTAKQGSAAIETLNKWLESIEKEEVKNAK